MKQTRLHLTHDEAWRILEWLEATVEVAPDGEDISVIVAICGRLARLLKTQSNTPEDA